VARRFASYGVRDKSSSEGKDCLREILNLCNNMKDMMAGGGRIT
jgi:hypothetical protein